MLRWPVKRAGEDNDHKYHYLLYGPSDGPRLAQCIGGHERTLEDLGVAIIRLFAFPREGKRLYKRYVVISYRYMCVCVCADTLHARNLIRATLENAVQSVAVGTEKNLNVRPCHDLWMISRREFFRWISQPIRLEPTTGVARRQGTSGILISRKSDTHRQYTFNTARDS